MIWKPNVTVAAVIDKNGKFLLVEEHADGKTVLNQPAGHLDEGESLIQAVIRETLEETAWHIEPVALLGVYRWQNPQNSTTYLRFAFIGRAFQHDPERPLDKDILRAVWMSPTEIARTATPHRSPQVQLCMDDYLAGKRYPLTVLQEVTSQPRLHPEK